MSTPPLLAAALEYAERGWSIIPIRHGRTERQYKRPALRTWRCYQTAAPSGAELRSMFAQRGLHGLAVVLGDVSGGLVCRDFDRPDLYRAWAGGHKVLANTLPTVRTASGFHVYITCPGERLRFVEGGELRGRGGYTLLPPSLHPEGKPYEWIIRPGSTPPPIIDPVESGLIAPPVPGARGEHEHAPELRGHATESTERTESTETTEITESTEECMGAALCLEPTDRPTSALAPPPDFAPDVLAAIASTLPERVGVRWRFVFDLARALKAIPRLADAPLAELKPVVREWHRRALPRIGTKPFEETWIDFTKGWDKVRFPRGAEPMMQILERARAAEPPARAAEFEQEGARLLASICRELQRTAGVQPFYLGCRTAGRLVGADHTTAWRWLWLMQTEGLIVVVERGGQADNPRRATRFRYIGG